MEVELIRNLSQQEKSHLLNFLISRDYQNLAPVVINYVDFMRNNQSGSQIMSGLANKPSFSVNNNSTQTPISTLAAYKPLSPVTPTYSSNKSSLPSIPKFTSNKPMSPTVTSIPIIPTPIVPLLPSMSTIPTSNAFQKGDFGAIKPNLQKWQGQDVWVNKAKIVVKNMNNGTLRTFVTSPIDGSQIQGGYYWDGQIKIPAAYISHYVEKYNIFPSEEIYNYVDDKYDELMGH